MAVGLFCRYFMEDSSGTVVSVQQGVFRTNCIDCLDRTNVVQSMLAHRSLQEQLQVRLLYIHLYTCTCNVDTVYYNSRVHRFKSRLSVVVSIPLCSTFDVLCIYINEAWECSYVSTCTYTDSH